MVNFLKRAVDALACEVKDRVTEADVVDGLSFQIWKDCAQVLQDISSARLRRMRQPPISGDKAIFFDPHENTQEFLRELSGKGDVDVAYEDQLASVDPMWVSSSKKSDYDLDASPRPFYRLAKGYRKKQPKPQFVFDAEGPLAIP